jgi:hypothetical protein
MIQILEKQNKLKITMIIKIMKKKRKKKKRMKKRMRMKKMSIMFTMILITK